jgi:hypothetical protein
MIYTFNRDLNKESACPDGRPRGLISNMERYSTRQDEKNSMNPINPINSMSLLGEKVHVGKA